MKTTIDLPDELLIEAKKRAADLRTSLKELMTRGLRRELAMEAANEPAGAKIRWIVVDGGLPPGIEMADRAQMHEWIRSQQ